MRHSIAWGYLAVLLLGYGFAGWLLAAFQVSWSVWIGTLLITLHLIRSGTAAIVLATGWVIGVMSVAAVAKSWAAVWDSRVPHEQAQLWAKGLLLIGIGAIGLVLILAFARSAMVQLGLKGKRASYSLIGLIWSALAVGTLLYCVGIG